MQYVIRTEFEGPGFVAVPNSVAQAAELSAEALGVLVYLASLPRGFIVRPCTVQQRFSFGKDRWQRIARELRACGSLQDEPLRGAGGRIVGRQIVVGWPKAERPEAGKPGCWSHHQKPENPAAGKPAMLSRKTRHVEPENPAPYKEEEKETRAHEARGAASHALPPEKAARPSALRKGGTARKLRRPTPGQAESAGPLPEGAHLLAGLSAWEKSQIRTGGHVLIRGFGLVKSGSAASQALQASLRQYEAQL